MNNKTTIFIIVSFIIIVNALLYYKNTPINLPTNDSKIVNQKDISDKQITDTETDSLDTTEQTPKNNSKPKSYKEIFKEPKEANIFDKLQEEQKVKSLNERSKMLIEETDRMIEEQHLTLEDKELSQEDKDSLQKSHKKLKNLQEKLKELNYEN